MLTKLKSLQNHQGFMKYFKNISWLFAEKILRMAVGLFVGIWVARYLGPKQFGLFSYAQSFVGLFTAIATLGLDGIVVRELVKDAGRRDELIGTAFWMKLIGAFGVLVALAIAVNFTSNDHYTNILIFIIASATIFQSFNVIDLYFQSKVLSKYVVYANIISLFLSSMVKITLILYEAPLIAFAWVVLFDSFVLACGFIYFYIKNNSTFNIKNLTFKRETAVSLLKDSWPLILSSFVTMLYMKIDQIMIMEILGAKAVGQYAAAVRLSGAWYFIPAILANSFFPSILASKNRSQLEYKMKLQKFYSLMIAISLPISLILAYFSNFIILSLFGATYMEAVKIFQVHIFASVFVFLFVASGMWILSENFTKLAFYRNLLAAIVNIILNWYLIPIYGAVGAAYATIIAFAMAGYFFDITNSKTKEQFILKTKAIYLKNLFKN